MPLKKKKQQNAEKAVQKMDEDKKQSDNSESDDSENEDISDAYAGNEVSIFCIEMIQKIIIIY